jgi:hypothetical protein
LNSIILFVFLEMKLSMEKAYFTPQPMRVGTHHPQTYLLTVYIRIKLHMDLQADKSPVIVKGPFFP